MGSLRFMAQGFLHATCLGTPTVWVGDTVEPLYTILDAIALTKSI